MGTFEETYRIEMSGFTFEQVSRVRELVGHIVSELRESGVAARATGCEVLELGHRRIESF